MKTIDLADCFDPGSLRSGTYVAASTSDAYGPLLAAIASGHARFLGEHIDEDGVKSVAAQVGRVANGRRNPAIGISREFFTTVLKDYEDWKEKWWREAIQNSVDARASRIDCYITHNEDGTVSVASEDNGGGMDEDVLINKFLMLGGSTKKLGGGAAGGFGKAKELLILPWLSWSVHTRDRMVRGEGIDYTIHEAPYKNGTRVEVVMPSDQTTNEAAAIAIIEKCYLPQIEFSVYLQRGDGARDTWHPRAALVGDEMLEQVEDKAQIWIANVKYDAYRMYIRVNGIYMFNRWVSKIEGKQLIVEITAPSIEVLTANRDGFRDREIGYRLDKLTERISKDVLSALKSKKGLIRKKYQGSGKFQAERAQAEALAQIGHIPETRDGETQVSERDIEAISRVFEYASERSSNLPDAALSRELLESVQFTGAYHVEEAVKQLAWNPDFFVINEIEDFKVPVKFLPESMKPQVLRLARTWTELCRYVLMQLGNFRPFGVGFVFSETAGAMYSEEDDERWLMLNPFKSPRYDRKDTWTPSNVEDLKKLYAFAIHECTHLADGVIYHDESFSTALTMNIAKTADGFRKIRKIVASIRMKDQPIADTSSRYAANPAPPSARAHRLSQRIGGF